MKKIIIGICIGIILLGFVLNLFGLLFFINPTIPQFPDTSCINDSDCNPISQPLSCTIGCPGCASYFLSDDKVILVNRKWTKFCPFKVPRMFYLCTECIGAILIPGKNMIKCQDHKCIKNIPINAADN